MASGDTLQIFYAWGASVPYSTTYPDFSVIQSATSKECFPIANFDNASTDYLDFTGVLPDYYDAGGVTCTIIWAYANTSTGPTWGIAFRAVPNDTEDLDLNHTYDYNTVVPGIPSSVGEVGYDNITFTNGVDMDSLAAGQLFNLRIRRTSGSYVARLLAIHMKET